VGGLALLVVAVLLEVTVVTALDPGLDTLGGRLAVQVALAASLAAVAFYFANPGRMTEPVMLGLRRSLIPPLRPAALAYVAYIGAAILIALAIQPEQEDVTEQLGYGESTAANVAVAMLVVAIAPLTEELFFRGFMFAGLRRRLPFLGAAAISSGIWGLFHYTGPGTWGVVLQLAAFGVILSWLYERTGSLWPPIAVHALNNAIAFAILTS
jgi:membrane protease YdiL (CAAX protease family)